MTDDAATVIIPNYNGAAFLNDLLASLRRQSLPPREVLVVDDASTDDSCARLAGHRPAVRLIRNPSNLGFAGACNVGLRAAQTPFVVLLNNDTTVDEHWLARGLAAFDAPDVAAVASLVLLAEPPHLIDSAGDLYSVVGGAQKRGHLEPADAARELPRDVFSACGASAFYRREAVAAVGYLDDRLSSYYEDVDLGFRLAWAGWRCRFAPESICYHRLSASYDPRGWTYHFNSARNAEIVYQAFMPDAIKQSCRRARSVYLALQAFHKWRLGCLAAHRAGRTAARRSRDWIEAKQSELAPHRRATDHDIERRLQFNWWRLHVASRRRRAPRGRRS